MSQQINLFNPIFLKQRKYFSAATMLQIIGIVAVATFGIYGYAVQERMRVQGLAMELERKMHKQRGQLAELVTQTTAHQRSTLLESEIARIRKQIRSGNELLARIQTGELGNTQGFGRYLEAFARRTLHGVWLTGFSVGEGESDVTLRGRVLNPDLVAPYVRLLNDEPVMRGRKVLELTLSAVKLAPARAMSPALGAAPSAPVGGNAAAAEFLEFRMVIPRSIGGPSAGIGASIPNRLAGSALPGAGT